MNNAVAVRIEIHPDALLDEVIGDMLALSGRLNMPVAGSYRGVTIAADQLDTPHDVRRRYQDAWMGEKGVGPGNSA